MNIEIGIILLTFILSVNANAIIYRTFDRDPVPNELPENYLDFLQEKMKKYPKKPIKNLTNSEDDLEKRMKYLKIEQIVNSTFKNEQPKRTHKKFSESFIKIMAEKIDELSLSSIPEIQDKLNEKIIKYNPNSGSVVRKYGTESCELLSLLRSDDTSNKNKEYKSVQVCPWHYVLSTREDRYPYMRVNAVCNCKNCLAKTVFDLDAKKFSTCQQQFTLMPSLIKEQASPTDEPKWVFAMEEVATSCTCTIKLNPY